MKKVKVLQERLGLAVLAVGAVLLAVLSLLVLHTPAYGDERYGDEGSGVAVATLELTQAIADIPESYGTFFPVQWGGGSLYQLKGRLASLGCTMNNVWLYDDDQWHLYSHYDIPRETFFIQHFIRDYADGIPATTVYASCSDQPRQQLQPTEIIADVPREYGTAFELQWGGGTLIHLQGRFATMGCIANSITVHDDITGAEHVYNQYGTSSTDPTSQQFIATYGQFIPPGTLYATCIDICTFQPNEDAELRRCLTRKEIGTYENQYEDRLWYFKVEGYLNALRSADTCTADFSFVVQNEVLPLLPIRPDTCVIRGRWSGGNIAYQFPSYSLGDQDWNPTRDLYEDGFLRGIHAPPVIFYRKDNGGGYCGDVRANLPEDHWRRKQCDTPEFHTEVHELCHINQSFGWLRHVTGDTKDANSDFPDLLTHYRESAYGQRFLNLVSFTHLGPNQWGDWEWTDWALPNDSIFKELYSDNPVELAAELCTMYIIDQLGMESKYRYYENVPSILFPDGSWRGSYRDFLDEPRNINVNRWLTPEIREWLETYMILPALDE